MGATESDTTGELGLGRVAQKLAVRAHDHGKLARVDVELLDEGPCLGIGFGIEALVGMAVAAQEVLQPQHVAAARVADNDRAAATGLDQPNAAQNEGAHDALAKLGFRDQERTQPVGRNDKRVHLVFGNGVDQSRAPGKLRQLAHERAGPMRDDQATRLRRAALEDVDMTGDGDGHPLGDLPDVRQRLARGIDTARAEPAHALDLGRLEREEHLRASRLDGRLLRVRHWILAKFRGPAIIYRSKP